MSQHNTTTSEHADRELERRIWSFLLSLHVPALRHVRIDAAAGVVRLRGHVTSFYAKQLVQHSARRLVGEGQVVDEIEVATPSKFRDGSLLRPLAAVSAAIALLLVGSGCSKSEPPRVPVQPVTGQVTFEGRPAKGAWVVFHAKGASESFPSPNAYADAQGNFTIGTYSAGDGAPLGEYTITVQW